MELMEGGSRRFQVVDGLQEELKQKQLVGSVF
jgi:hypothetical protein